MERTLNDKKMGNSQFKVNIAKFAVKNAGLSGDEYQDMEKKKLPEKRKLPEKQPMVSSQEYRVKMVGGELSG
ncbi:hypothetical protein Hanom_Chr05g00449271 [Helianthus anomalus]